MRRVKYYNFEIIKENDKFKNEMPPLNAVNVVR